MTNTSTFFSWDSITNITTITTIVILIVQFTKDYIPIPTQILSYIISTILLISEDIYKKSWSNIPMSLINGFLVASLASNSAALVSRIAG